MLLLFSYSASADRGDTLIVNADIVNLRTQPSDSSRVYKRLAINREVIEISRYEKWVEVTTNDKKLDYGWIHQSLLTSIEGRSISSPDSRQFEVFRTHFVSLLKKYDENTGGLPFTGVRLLDAGSLQLTATSHWFELPSGERDTILSEVFDLWKKYVDTGISVMVEIINAEGEQHMMMFK